MRGRKRNRNKVVMVGLLLACSVFASLTIIFAFKSREYKIQKQKSVSALSTLEEQYDTQDASLAALQLEVDDKSAYIDEWMDVFTSLSEGAVDEKQEDSNVRKSAYSDLYPEMRVSNESKTNNTSGKKVVYLTFDDGPSDKTGQVLDLLDEYGIKATFFVTYTDKPELRKYYKEIVNRGHTIGVHTATHNYKKIYASVEAYLEDFYQVYQAIYEETGVYPVLFRYPGGSTSLYSYSSGNLIHEEMQQRGFVYFDWNVSSGDGGKQATEDSILQWVTEGVTRRKESVVLMHDTRTVTVGILPEILKQLVAMDCVFEPLEINTPKVQFYDKIY